MYQAQQQFFATYASRDIPFRKAQLHKLHSAVKIHEHRLLDALHADLHKSAIEGYLTEIGLVLSECSHALAHVRQWARPKMIRPALVQLPSTCWRSEEHTSELQSQ